MNNSYPFPNRKVGVFEKDCFYIEPENSDYNSQIEIYQKKTSQVAVNIKQQYFSIESELIKSFYYVNPTSSNLSTSSVKFATIIRESANLFEQISRLIYDSLFESKSNINIYNYLSLDKYLNYNSITLHCPILNNVVGKHSYILTPFNELKGWDRESKLEEKNIPKWWIAYRKVKHSPSELSEYSNMENAIRGLLASFIIISKYLGSGIVSGNLHKPEISNAIIIQRQLIVDQSRLFMIADDLFGYTFE